MKRMQYRNRPMITVLGSPSFSITMVLAKVKISTVPIPYAVRHKPVAKKKNTLVLNSIQEDWYDLVKPMSVFVPIFSEWMKTGRKFMWNPNNMPTTASTKIKTSRSIIRATFLAVAIIDWEFFSTFTSNFKMSGITTSMIAAPKKNAME